MMRLRLGILVLLPLVVAAVACERRAGASATATDRVVGATTQAVIAPKMLAEVGGGGAASAFDVLRANYAPYCRPGDDLAFPLKVLSVSADETTFWRGSRDLFFTWCRDH